MIGICDSCGLDAELFQLPGRKDKNCTECDANIATMVLLYEMLIEADRLGIDAIEIESEVMEVLLSYLQRCGMNQEAQV